MILINKNGPEKGWIKITVIRVKISCFQLYCFQGTVTSLESYLPLKTGLKSHCLSVRFQEKFFFFPFVKEKYGGDLCFYLQSYFPKTDFLRTWMDWGGMGRREKLDKKIKKEKDKTVKSEN